MPAGVGCTPWLRGEHLGLTPCLRFEGLHLVSHAPLTGTSRALRLARSAAHTGATAARPVRRGPKRHTLEEAEREA
eukprot:1545535-Pyramimonas_sp.AAC.1